MLYIKDDSNTTAHFYYTYRISNKLLNKHYYGVRKSKLSPELDLGIKYFSSSTNKEFIKDQKYNPQNYKYKIIYIFNDYRAASLFEIKLLKKVNAVKNPNFYNLAIYCNSALNCDNTGKLVVIDIRTNNYVRVSTQEYHKNKEFYKCNLHNSQTAFDTSTSTYKIVSKLEFNNNPNLKGVNYGKVSGKNNPNAILMYIYDNENKLQHTIHGDSAEKSENFNLPWHNLKKSARNYGEPIGMCKFSRTELRKKNKQKFIGWYALYDGDERKEHNVDFDIKYEQQQGLKKNIPVVKTGKGGKYNPRALKIGIFNELGQMKFFCHGNISEVCKEYNLPLAAFRTSYRNAGRPLYSNSESNIKRLQTKGVYKYKGWCAKKLVDFC